MERGDRVRIKVHPKTKQRKIAGFGIVISTGKSWATGNPTIDIRLDGGLVILDLWARYVERGES